MALYKHSQGESSAVVVQPPTTANSFDRKNIADQILLDCPEVYFRFDEETGNVAVDHSGFGRNGQYGLSVQLGKAPISTAARCAYNPQMTYSHPINQKQDLSAVLLVKLLPQTDYGAMFYVGNRSCGFALGKGSGGNFGQNGNNLVGIASYVDYIDTPAQFLSGINLLGITLRNRDGLLTVFLNGLPVFYRTFSYYYPPNGSGWVGFNADQQFPPALCNYGDFAVFGCELAPCRMFAYWKAVQLMNA